jgi:hypothetical protein
MGQDSQDSLSSATQRVNGLIFVLCLLRVSLFPVHCCSLFHSFGTNKSPNDNAMKFSHLA